MNQSTLIEVAYTKLIHEACQPDLDLRLLVGHANLIDRLKDPAARERSGTTKGGPQQTSKGPLKIYSSNQAEDQNSYK
jgi:hypothetical protein